MLSNALEHVTQISVRIQPTQRCRADQAIDGGSAFAACGTCEFARLRYATKVADVEALVPRKS
jgi:hypothetical protein